MITSRHVLTAAHCNLEHLYMVRLGEHDFANTNDGEHQDVKVIHVMQHEYYDKNLMINDIAILDLEHDVEFNGKIVACFFFFFLNDTLIVDLI